MSAKTYPTELVLLILALILCLAAWLFLSLSGMELSGDLLRIACSLGLWAGLALAAS